MKYITHSCVFQVWDKSCSFNCLQSLEGHTSQVLSLHNCGKFLYSGSADGIVIVWDLDSYEQLKVPKSICSNLAILTSRRERPKSVGPLPFKIQEIPFKIY